MWAFLSGKGEVGCGGGGGFKLSLHVFTRLHIREAWPSFEVSGVVISKDRELIYLFLTMYIGRCYSDCYILEKLLSSSRGCAKT